MRWSKDQMMIDDDGGVMFNIACRLGTGTLWDAPRVFYCETPVSSVSRVMCNPELFICTNLLFDNTLVAFARAAQGYPNIEPHGNMLPQNKQKSPALCGLREPEIFSDLIRDRRFFAAGRWPFYDQLETLNTLPTSSGLS